MSEAILFRQCLGLNDALSISSQTADPKRGIERDIAQIVQNKAAMNPQTWVGRPERF